VSVTVHVPDELAARLRAEATRRGAEADDVATELLTAGLDRNADPLEAFIGSGHSGRDDLGRRHREILAERLTGKTARDA
jgi:hypothetical protein